MEQEMHKESFFDRGRRLLAEEKARERDNPPAKTRRKRRSSVRMEIAASVPNEECLRMVGYTQKQMMRILAKSGTNSEFFALALARKGIGPEQVANGLVEGLQAETPMVRRGMVVVDPKSKDPIMLPDYHTRLAYWDRIIAIVGAVYKAKDEVGPQVSPTFVKVIQIFDSLPPEDKRRVVDGDFTVLEEKRAGGNGNDGPRSRF